LGNQLTLRLVRLGTDFFRVASAWRRSWGLRPATFAILRTHLMRCSRDLMDKLHLIRYFVELRIALSVNKIFLVTRRRFLKIVCWDGLLFLP
jgi:hypothetical protein